MAEVTSGKNLTVIVLNEDEAETLRDLIVDYIDHYEEASREGGEPESYSVLHGLYEAFR